MKGEIIYKLLSLLEEKALNATDLVDVFISSGYGASIGKIEYEFNKKVDKRIQKQAKKDKIRKIKKYLSKLRKENFIQENSSEEIIITSKGKQKLNIFKKNYSLNKFIYKKEGGDNVIMISYDIPIIFNRERNILRDILKMLGFNLVHKSVWVGKVKLPKEFIIDLEKLGILDYVEILEVTKKGSIKNIN